MGCSGALEEGFITTQKELSDFVFPPLHHMRDNNVSRYITRIIRDNDRKDVPKYVVTLLSSRSLRKGGVAELAAHPIIRYSEEHARTGHSTGTNLDTYMENIGIALSKAGGMALNKYKDVHANVNPPSFSVLGIENALYVEEFLLNSSHQTWII